LRAGSTEMTGGPAEHAPASTPRVSHARSSATDAAKAPSDRFRASCRAEGRASGAAALGESMIGGRGGVGEVLTEALGLGKS
jgi:hypothetical protein